MKISELVKQLEKLKKEHGDIEVYHEDFEYGPLPIYSVEKDLDDFGKESDFVLLG